MFDLGDGTCIVSTTDFFMPIVDDAFTFGSIASVNAISDVYAMGGEPVMAIAILGWPINKIPPEVAKEVLEELPRQVEDYHQLAGLTPGDYSKNLNSDIIYQKENMRL